MVPSPSLNPFSWYRQMQQEQPIYYDPDFMLNFGGQGVWHIFRYQDVKRVLSDYKSFSNEYSPKTEENPISHSIAFTDPPRHKKLRSIISGFFVPPKITKLSNWIHAQCRKLLQPAIDHGEIDFMNQFSLPLPVNVISYLLGVPGENHQQVNIWSKAFTASPTEMEGGTQAYYRSQQEMADFFIRLIEERARKPQGDLISELLAADYEGEKLSKQDVLGFCMVLLMAGNETTANLISNAMLTLLEYPQIEAQLRRNPDNLPQFINEVLRFRAPVQSMYRIATKDVELGGQVIKKGDYINAWIGSANHDPSVFPAPEVLDLNRDNQSLLSFGHGIHYCIGKPLAKLEVQSAFEVIFQFIHKLKLKPGTSLEVHPSLLVYSLKELPIICEIK